jgi:fibronectin type 3 domain-containing protein
MDRNVQVILQIPLPNPDGLKNVSSNAVVKRVTLKVTTGNEVLVTKELTISGNTASGTISIPPGKSRKFTAEAMDANNIIQWQGSKTIDIVDDFKVDLELTPILPSTSNLVAIEQGNSVSLSWTKNSDPDFDSYNLYRSPFDSDIGVRLFISTVNTETAYLDTTVKEGNLYFYTLVVFDSEDLKTESKVNIIPNFPPTASELQSDSLIFNYNTKYYEAKLLWTQNNDSDFASYELYRSTSNNVLGTLIYSTPDVTKRDYWDDSKLSEGDIYFYTLVVTDTKGLKTESIMVQIDVPITLPTPSILEGSWDGYMYLIWTKNYDFDFARYELYRSNSENLLGTLMYSTPDINNVVYVDSTVSQNGSYYYTLLVFDTSGNSSNSNVVLMVLIP